MSDWRSLPVEKVHRLFLERVSSILIDNVFEGVRREEPVIRWRDAEHLAEIISLDLAEDPKPQEAVLETIDKVYKFSVKTGHPYFMNQLFSGLDPYGLAGQWLTDSLNASIYTYEVAPVLTLIEQTLARRVLDMFYGPDVAGDAIFCPGGSYANGSAIGLARYWLDPETKSSGVSGLRLVIFTSEDAHYSVMKWASFCGIGEKNVVLVATDECGRMNARSLEASILEEKEGGRTGFMVCATAGTTVLGAIDPLAEIADLCDRHNIWLHVDAAWGGGLVFSPKHRALLGPIHRADSVAFNPHKMLAVPQQCSMLLTRHDGITKASNSREASYLFQKDKFYDSKLDVGDKYAQCGRRPDVLKFWIMWQAKGTSGFEKHVDHLMYLSDHLRSEIERRVGFKLVARSSFINVCFWYVPPSLRNKNGTYDYNEKLHRQKIPAQGLYLIDSYRVVSTETLIPSAAEGGVPSQDYVCNCTTVAPKLKEMMTRRGSLMIGYQPLRQKPNFFRFVVQNSGMDISDVDYVLKELERMGQNL